MKTLLLEVRDRMTFIPVLAVVMKPDCPEFGDQLESQRYLMRRCGYGFDMPSVLLTKASGDGSARCDPYAWGDRTMKEAHVYIEREWTTLRDGDVVDIEFILGETGMMKRPEREEHHEAP